MGTEKVEKFGERLATLKQYADENDPIILAAETVNDRIQTAAAIAASRFGGSATPADVLMITRMLEDAEIGFAQDGDDENDDPEDEDGPGDGHEGP